MIAILGATGYVGLSIARRLAGGREKLVLFARDPSRLAQHAWPAHVSLQHVDAFDATPFDLVINAIGAGDPGRVAAMGGAILDVTQHWDQRALTTMGPQTRYVFLSSGAIYGAFDAPATASSRLCLPVNDLGSVAPYTISKLHAEARHRHAADRAILDLRIFSYADPALSLTGRFFLAELARSVAEGKPFVTTPAEMNRDYCGAEELTQLVHCWLACGAPNMAADLYSLAPVSKSELLAKAAQRYGLEVRLADTGAASPTGAKPTYASNHRIAEALGYAPRRNSLDIVLSTLDRIAEAKGAPAFAPPG